MNVKDIYSLFQKTKGVVTDTRLSVENSFFVALKGKNFDGNNFAEEAIKKGASYALVNICLLYTSPSPRDLSTSRMPSSA